ncbi:unnamed protein product [Tilletia controversa]|nr:unnamed protein product [Tilletia controversa]
MALGSSSSSGRGQGQGQGRGRGRGRGSGGQGSARARGRGRSHVAVDEFKEKSTPAARAAQLFHHARQSELNARKDIASTTKAAIAKHEAVQKAAASLSSSSAQAGSQLPLAELIKALSSSTDPAAANTTIDVRRAMSLARALLKSNRASLAALAHISKLVLTDIVRWPSSDKDMKGKVGDAEIAKAVAACRRAALEIEQHPHPSSSSSSSAKTTTLSPAKGYSWEGKREANDLQSFLESQSPSKRRKITQAEERLSREWGNFLLPLDSHGDSVRSSTAQIVAVKGEPGGEADQALPQYEIPCVLDEGLLKGRSALVNRAPVMTLWTTILLERMGFQRREALSLAQCYVSTTSTARAVNLGLAPSTDRDKASTAGPKQPHFVLMGVKLPVLQLQQRTASGDVGEYRAIYDGQVVDPQKAFDYIFRSFYQTLPYIHGALLLLADSYLDPTGQDTDADELHAVAWDLYCDFRPDTGGEWGKRARVSCDVVLGLRKGWRDRLKEKKEGAEEVLRLEHRERIAGTDKVKEKVDPSHLPSAAPSVKSEPANDEN